MRALVTGGAGFIGSHLAEALVKRGHRVRIVDDLSSGNLRNIAGIRKKIDFIRGDIRELQVLKKAVRGIDVIFHQAAFRSVPKSVKDPLGYHEANCTATLRLLESARAHGVRRMVYASSSSVYGLTPLPQKEEMTPKPHSPYAASKLAGEVYSAMFTRLYGLETVGLRYFNVFGPRQSLENEYAVVVPKFITCLLKGQAPPIHGTGFQTRDFTYVGNVVQANLKAAAAPRAAGEVFNIACGRRYSVRQLVAALNKRLGLAIAPTFTPPRRGDALHTWADIRKAHRLLGYRVETLFVEGLHRTVTWFSQHREAWDR